MTENKAIEELKCYVSQSGTSHPAEIEIAIKALEEVQQYREIGTVEECRVARELQIPRAPRFTDFDDGSTFAYCPTCDYALDGVRPRLCVGIKTKFFDNVVYNRSCACPRCGQYLDLNCLRELYEEELSRIAEADMLREQQAQGEKKRG